MKRNVILKLAALAMMLAILLPSVFAATETIIPSVADLALKSGASFVIDGNIVKGISDDLTVSEFLSSLSEDGAYVTRPDGYRMADASRIGTGDKLITSSGTYTLVVKGDANGDSYVSTKDIIRAKKLMASGAHNECELAALDYNGDGVINTTDIEEMADYVVVNVSEPALADVEPADLGDDFYATIDLSYTDNALQACFGGDVVATDKRENDPNQTWRFTRNDDGTYSIESLGMGEVIDAAYASSDFGTNIGIYKNNYAQNQKWYVIEYGDGYVFSAAHAEDRVFDITEQSTANGANLQLYGVNYTPSQIFHINKVQDVPTDVAEYVARFEPLAVEETFYVNIEYGSKSIAPDASGNVCLQSSFPYWKFEYQSGGCYKLTSTFNGKVLDIANGTMANSTNIQTYESNDTTAQRWFIYMKNGKAMFASVKDQSFVIDGYSGLDNEGTNVHLYTMNGTTAQWFTLGDYTTTLPEYSVTCPYNSVVYGRYSSLEAAKAQAIGYLGYVVRNQQGTIVYNPNPSYGAAKILYHAKLNADYARLNGYRYGDASVNPALDKTEKVVSCDRFVGWTLYDAGYNRNGQPATKGYTLYGPLENLLISLGFEKHTNLADVQPGDIIFVGYSYNLAVPSNYKSYPCHVFIAASAYNGGSSYRYDAGSNSRLQSVQPSYEPLSYTDNVFRFAYRPK